MRITGGMIRNNSLNSLYDNMSRLDTLFSQMDTMKKIQKPSDDPIILGRSLKLRLNVMENEQHQSNVDEANAWMDVTETALSNMTEILKEIRTKCNQAANDTLTPEDRQKIQLEIEGLYEQLKQEANVTYGGRYVFSGFKTDQEVYLNQDRTLGKDVELSGNITLVDSMTLATDMTLPNGTVLTAGTVLAKGTTLPEGTVIPAGNTLPKGTVNPEVLGKVEGQHIQYEIGVGTKIEVNTLKIPGLMTQIGADLEKIKIALVGDPNATPPVDPLPEEELNQMFTEMLGEMDENLSQLSEVVAELGSKQNRLEYTESRLSDDKTNLTEILSKTEDVNIEETYVQFNAQYMVYQSALQATSKIIMNTLADFLR